MKHAVLGRMAAALVLAVACQQADDDEPSSNEAQTSGGSAGTENVDATAGASETQAGALTAVGGDENGVEPGRSGAPPTMGGQGGAQPTEPAAGGAACGTDAEDRECARCLAAHCCSAWQACEVDEDCHACTVCLDAQLDLGECVVMNLCDIAPEATSRMLLCGLEPCEQECGFD